MTETVTVTVQTAAGAVSFTGVVPVSSQVDRRSEGLDSWTSDELVDELRRRLAEGQR
jgi:hypothetical protein